ncbi:MAG: Jag N-terminal domain-containing protein, partial [Ilumatobacteraceae bacterium]
MEWVETTGRTVDVAKEAALDQLGIVADEAEFEIVEEPRPGLFGRLRGEARVRARVRPATVRPKQDRRRSPKRDRPAAGGLAGEAEASSGGRRDTEADAGESRSSGARRRPAERTSSGPPPRATSSPPAQGDAMTADREADDRPAPSTEDVQRAAETFVNGLMTSFGLEAAVSSSVEEQEIEVRVDGGSLGLLIGPGGRTLLAIQDLARVSAQRRLGDHETRLRI